MLSAMVGVDLSIVTASAIIFGVNLSGFNLRSDRCRLSGSGSGSVRHMFIANNSVFVTFECIHGRSYVDGFFVDSVHVASAPKYRRRRGYRRSVRRAATMMEFGEGVMRTRGVRCHCGVERVSTPNM